MQLDGWSFDRYKSDDISTNYMKNELHRLGLLGLSSNEKFIPDEYMYTSIENRYALLQGLMDTDGHAHKSRGSAFFYTTSDRLSKQVEELVRSLGGTTYIWKRKELRKFVYKNREIRGNYPDIEVGVTLYGINPFYLSRKANRYNPNKGGKIQGVKQDIINNVTYHSTEPVKCLLIDSADHLYITDDYLVTHNTLEDKM